VPASMGQLLGALKRLRAEATTLAEHAYVAIQQHSFEPYWTFRAKIAEHAALVEVVRGRLPRLREMRSPNVDTIAAMVDREEQEILILTVKACLKFCFALSANPWLPVGARETFGHEVDTLQNARHVLEVVPADELPQDLLDDIGTAQMILEEIIAKSPPLTDFDQRAPAAAATAAAAETPPPAPASLASA
jgi:hypothetical protein